MNLDFNFKGGIVNLIKRRLHIIKIASSDEIL